MVLMVACEQHLAQNKPAPHSCFMLEDDFSICDRDHGRPTAAVSLRYTRVKLLGQNGLPLWDVGLASRAAILVASKSRQLYPRTGT
jgi:hypothetical protein